MPRTPKEDAPPTRAMNKVRTAHGTRVARRITCASCGKADTIDFAPKDPSRVLCRKCAFEAYGVLDPDDVSLRTHRVRCGVCRKMFDRVVDPKHTESGLATCSDCRAGIETAQGDKSKTATRVSPKVVRVKRKS